MAFRFENKGSYSGLEYEFDLVGRINIEDPNYWKELERLQKAAVDQYKGWHPAKKDSLPFNEAVEFTKKFQPWDPTNPDKDFARELRLAIAEQLGLKTDDDFERLKFYTSAGGPLDMHYIDGFVTFQPLGENREFAVTFDVTKNPEKEFPRADLLIEGDIPDPSENEQVYLNTIDEYAEKFGEVFKTKIAKKQAGFYSLRT